MKRLSRQPLARLQESGWRVAAALIALLLLIGLQDDAGAHAYLERSRPAANEVLETAPDDVRIWFTEPLEAAYTGAELFDAFGNPVETSDAVVDADDRNLLVLPLPGDLEPGTYTIAWRNISSVDGHPAEGFFAFTIGTEADIEIPAAPAVIGFGGSPTAVEAVGRWLVLLGLMGTLGGIVTAFWVLPGGTSVLSTLYRERIWQTLSLGMLVGLVSSLAGGIVLLVDQTMTIETDFSLPAMVDLLVDSNFGRYWQLRTVAIGILIGALALTPVIDGVPKWRRVVLTLLALFPLVPISLSSHAAAIGTGDSAAVVADIAHLAAGSFWVGGLLALAVTILTLRHAVTGQRLLALTAIIPRFSTLAIASVLVLIASGVYASWLQVGNLTALVETGYGRTLMLKLALTLVLVALGAVNLLILEPRLRSGTSIGGEFRQTVFAEALIGVALLVLVGVLTSLPTARGAVDAAGDRVESRLDEAGRQASLVISPGSVGANRYTVDVQGGELADASTIFLRFSSVGGDLSGIQEVELQPVGERRFEGAGSELSVVGDWDIEVILRQPGTADWRSTTEVRVGEQPAAASSPTSAARFPGITGALLMLVALAGIPLLVVGLRQPGLRLVAAAGGLLLVVGLAGLPLIAEIPDQSNEAASYPHHHHSGSVEPGDEIRSGPVR